MLARALGALTLTLALATSRASAQEAPVLSVREVDATDPSAVPGACVPRSAPGSAVARAPRPLQ